MANGPKGPSNLLDNSYNAMQQAMQSIHQNRLTAQQAASMNQAISALMNQAISVQMQQNANSLYIQQQNRIYRNWSLAKDPTVTDLMVLELLACGFTVEEVDTLRELARKSAEAHTYFKTDKPVYYRPQARARGRSAFGHSRLYKKSHEVGTKKCSATIVYTSLRGFVRPFPECKS